MTQSNNIIKSIRESSGIRLAVLFGSFFIFLLLSSIISLVIDKLPGDERTHTLISSTVQCVLGFCLPALLLAKFSTGKNRDSLKWLHLSTPPTLKAIVGVVMIYIISMPAMEWLIEWNANLHLPESMASIETLFRKWESNAEESSKMLLETHGWLSVLAGVLVIGILTGFSEELFFRGGLQGIFVRGFKNDRGTAIWLAAFVFSTMHFQFFGFIPRLLMGAFFGYLLVWTRSLWVPVFAHALNNSIVVITAAVTGEVSTSILDSQHSGIDFGNSMVVIGSVLLTVIFLTIFKDIFFKSNHRWQKSQLPPVTGK